MMIPGQYPSFPPPRGLDDADYGVFVCVCIIIIIPKSSACNRAHDIRGLGVVSG